MTAARLYRWFARDAEAEGHESPLVVGFFCAECGCRLDKVDRPCPMDHRPDGAA